MAKPGMVLAGVGGLAAIAAIALWPKKASAAPIEPPEGAPPIPDPPPAPSPGQGGAAQQGGQECAQLFERWKQLVDAALADTACQDAQDYSEEWWRLEAMRLSGDPFFEPSQQAQIYSAYNAAQQRCQANNNAALNAMAAYEECMLNQDLDPGRPSGATRGTRGTRGRYR